MIEAMGMRGGHAATQGVKVGHGVSHKDYGGVMARRSQGMGAFAMAWTGHKRIPRLRSVQQWHPPGLNFGWGNLSCARDLGPGVSSSSAVTPQTLARVPPPDAPHKWTWEFRAAALTHIEHLNNHMIKARLVTLLSRLSADRREYLDRLDGITQPRASRCTPTPMVSARACFRTNLVSHLMQARNTQTWEAKHSLPPSPTPPTPCPGRLRRPPGWLRPPNVGRITRRAHLERSWAHAVRPAASRC